MVYMSYYGYTAEFYIIDRIAWLSALGFRVQGVGFRTQKA